MGSAILSYVSEMTATKVGFETAIIHKSEGYEAICGDSQAEAELRRQKCDDVALLAAQAEERFKYLKLEYDNNVQSLVIKYVKQIEALFIRLHNAQKMRELEL